jgi:hypothetical protein
VSTNNWSRGASRDRVREVRLRLQINTTCAGLATLHGCHASVHGLQMAALLVAGASMACYGCNVSAVHEVCKIAIFAPQQPQHS